MRQILLFIFLVLLIFNGRAQSSSLDSLRLVLPIGNEAVINSIHYSKNGKWILTTSWDNTARIHESASGKELRILKNCQFGNTVFSPDGKLVLTAGSTARILDVLSGNELELLATKFDEVDHYDKVLFSHDGKLALTAKETTVRIYEVTTGNCLPDSNTHLRDDETLNDV